MAIKQTIESEDEIKTDKKTAEVIKMLKQATMERKENGEKEVPKEGVENMQKEKTVSAKH